MKNRIVNVIKTWICTLFFVYICLSISGCTDSSNVVVVYTTVDQVFSEPILRDFEKATGIRVKAVFDTEETKSTGVLNRLIAEKNHPQCDVFWSGDPVRAAILKEKGITAPYESPVAKAIPSYYKDPDHHWTGFSARARVLIYNTRGQTSPPVPHSIFQLVEPQYRNQVAIANPLFGTTTFHIAALFSTLGFKRAEAFLDKLKQNGVVLAASNGDVKRRVAQGTVFCGLTDTDDAITAKKEGEAVDYVFLDQGEGEIGTLVIPNTVSLINGAPHQENAKKVIDYLLTRETEAKLAISAGQMPLHKGVKTPPTIPSLDNIRPMKIDYEKTAKIMEEIQGVLKTWSQGL